MIPAPVAAELANEYNKKDNVLMYVCFLLLLEYLPFEKKTDIKKQKEMLVMVKINKKKKNNVPSAFSRTARDEFPYQRA